jgi:hypothetical protein
MVVDDYVGTIDRLMDLLKARTDTDSLGLVAVLGSMRKWAGTNQKRGVFSKAELVEAGGEEAAEELWRMIARH